MASLPLPTTSIAADKPSFNDEHKLTQDAKRDADHKHKWRLGDWSSVAGGKPRPWHAQSKVSRLHDKGWNDGIHSNNPGTQVKAYARKAPHVLVNPAEDFEYHAKYSASNASERSVQHGGAAPEPDAGVAYSFDAPRGPSDGSDVLGQAMNKAVARFEDQRTVRLIRDEYDVVKDGEDDDGPVASPMYEDEFEIVGHFEV